MTEVIRAKKAIVNIAGKEFDCYQLPDGSYRWSLKQISEAAGFNKDWLSMVIRRKKQALLELLKRGFSGAITNKGIEPEILIQQDLSGAITPLIEDNQIAGANPAWGMRTEDLEAVFKYAADMGREEAQAMLSMSITALFSQKADIVFRVRQTEVQYDTQNVLTYERLLEKYRGQPRRLKQIKSYTNQGKDPEWIEARFSGIVEGRNPYAQELAQREVTPRGFARNSNAIYEGLFDANATALKQEREVKKVRDGLDAFENTAVKFSEMAATRRMQRHNSIGDEQTVEQSQRASLAVRLVLDDVNC